MRWQLISKTALILAVVLAPRRPSLIGFCTSSVVAGGARHTLNFARMILEDSEIRSLGATGITAPIPRLLLGHSFGTQFA